MIRLRLSGTGEQSMDTRGDEDSDDIGEACTVGTWFISDPDPDAKQMYVSGPFGGWNVEGDQMRKRNRIFVTKTRLLPGEHQCEFVIDND